MTQSSLRKSITSHTGSWRVIEVEVKSKPEKNRILFLKKPGKSVFMFDDYVVSLFCFTQSPGGNIPLHYKLSTVMSRHPVSTGCAYCRSYYKSLTLVL